jgi:polyvinyl alcohol dehydrogenase (cytochrome)
MTRLRARSIAIAAVAVMAVGGASVPMSARGATTIIGPSDWPTYGHDAHHSFAGVTSLTTASAPTMSRAWFFPTGDAVTANPIVVANSVYVGSWDGYFYAIDRATGNLRWKYQLKQQPSINPSPGNPAPRDVTTDGGLVTSSAWFQPGAGGRPDLVIFGGGYTLYALNASSGALYWSHDYTGRPELAPDPANDSTRIFSSPVVVGNQVLVAVSADGEASHRGYVVSANLNNGNPVWRFETDVNTAGAVQNDGCGGVWSSLSVDEVRRLVTFGVADCKFLGAPPYHERVVALHAQDGSLAWVFTPPRLQGVAAGADPPCDFDFGTSVNLGSPDPLTGAPTFVGVGGKDGTYYRLDPATGSLRWARNVVFGGFAGGFIGTTADDGSRSYGATGIGDVGSSSGTCEPANPADTPAQEPSMHAFNRDGTVAWEKPGAAAYGATAVAGGMVFAGVATTPGVQVRDSATGSLLTTLAAASDCFCAIAVSGNAAFFGTGAPQQGTGDGVSAYTPLGAAPRG